MVDRWYRDPNQPIPRTDITRFPHAVLEVKLSLPEGQTAPEWVTDLTESGFLTEVGPICRKNSQNMELYKGNVPASNCCIEMSHYQEHPCLHIGLQVAKGCRMTAS